MVSCKAKPAFIGLLVSGLVLVLLGSILIYGFKVMIRNQINKELIIDPNSKVYKNWIQPPVPVSMQFFVFNVTNHEELKSNPQATIKLQQLGPYSYRESRLKRNITFLNGGEQVSYRENRSFIFDEAASDGNTTDVVWTLNLALVSVSSMFRFTPEWERWAVAAAMRLVNDGDLFVNHTVHELIWGYKDPLLAKVKPLVKRFLKKDIDDEIGLFHGKNNTDDGLYKIFTGKKHSEKFGLIDSWNNQTVLRYWTDEYGNSINGSDGTIFPSPVDKDEKLYFFSTDICRSIYATYESEQELRGVRLRRFVPPPAVFEAYPANSGNGAFCTPDLKHCMSSGLLNLTSCQANQPAVASLPHFYQGAPKLFARFSGLRPLKQLHQTYIDVEPMTGAAMNVAKRLQVNMYVEPIEGFSQFTNWSTVVFPLIWINESATLTESLAADFKHEVYRAVLITHVLQFSAIALGALLLLVALLVGLYLYRNRASHQYGLMADDSDD